MRISDWSSDVCSSDLRGHVETHRPAAANAGDAAGAAVVRGADAGIRGVARTLAAGGLRVLHRPRAAPRAGARRAGAVRRRTSVLRDRRVRDAGRSGRGGDAGRVRRSEEHTSELQSLMRITYAVFCLNKKKT